MSYRVSVTADATAELVEIADWYARRAQSKSVEEAWLDGIGKAIATLGIRRNGIHWLAKVTGLSSSCVNCITAAGVAKLIVSFSGSAVTLSRFFPYGMRHNAT